MVDNVTVDTITGNPIVSTDQDGTAHVQYVKLKFGPDDTFTIVQDGTGLPVTPFAAILEIGSTEIIDEADAEVAASGEYSATADLSLSGTKSGEILSFMLTSSVVSGGSGEVQTGKGVVMFFDADPNTTSGDNALDANGAENKTIIGQVQVEADEWDEDASGATLFKQVAIPFHALGTIFCVYRNTDTSAVWNSAGADNEELHINVWFRRDS